MIGIGDVMLKWAFNLTQDSSILVFKGSSLAVLQEGSLWLEIRAGAHKDKRC